MPTRNNPFNIIIQHIGILFSNLFNKKSQLINKYKNKILTFFKTISQDKTEFAQSKAVDQRVLTYDFRPPPFTIFSKISECNFSPALWEVLKNLTIFIHFFRRSTANGNLQISVVIKFI